MKRLILAAFLLAGCEAEIPDRPDGLLDEKPNTYAWVMDAFYEKHNLEGPKERGLVLYAGVETERFAAMLGLTQYVPTMLCMWHRESGYKVIDGDDKKSFGITQTMKKQEKQWRKFWLKYGIALPSIDDPMTQIAFGVSEFQEKLRYAKGDEFDAVRRYNGGIPGNKSYGKAVRYARNVFWSRKIIFGVDLPNTPKAREAYGKEKRGRKHGAN